MTDEPTRPLEYDNKEEVIKENLDVLFPLASEKEMPETKFPLSPSLLISKWHQDQVTDLGKQMKFSEQEKRQMTEKNIEGNKRSSIGMISYYPSSSRSHQNVGDSETKSILEEYEKGLQGVL